MPPKAVDWEEIVKRGVESDTLDYKSAQNWRLLPRAGKMKFVRHALAMANTKGGYVVVGVGEDPAGRPAVYTGLTEEESASFDPSMVGSFINHYVDPPIEFTLERPIVDGKRYAIFHIRPFKDIPHVCSCGYEHELLQGVFYIRTPDASSRPAYRASEIQGLLTRAMRNQRAVLGRMLRGLLQESNLFDAPRRPVKRKEEAKSHFEEEIRHALSAFRKLPLVRQKGKDLLAFSFAVMPYRYEPERFSFSLLQEFQKETSRYPGGEFFPDPPEKRKEYLTNVACRTAGEGALCQFHRSGLLFFASLLPLGEGGILEETVFEKLLERLLFFAGKWARKSALGKGKLYFQIQLFPSSSLQLRKKDDTVIRLGANGAREITFTLAVEKLTAGKETGIKETFLQELRSVF